MGSSPDTQDRVWHPLSSIAVRCNRTADAATHRSMPLCTYIRRGSIRSYQCVPDGHTVLPASRRDLDRSGCMLMRSEPGKGFRIDWACQAVTPRAGTPIRVSGNRHVDHRSCDARHGSGGTRPARMDSGNRAFAQAALRTTCRQGRCLSSTTGSNRVPRRVRTDLSLSDCCDGWIPGKDDHA